MSAHPGDYDLFGVDSSRRAPPRQLTDTKDEDEIEPAYSPDGSQLAFVRGLPDQGPTHVYVMRSDGTGARRVVRNGRAPAWAPDGSRLAFVRAASLYVVDADGKHLKKVVTGPASGVRGVREPDWSPDGRTIVFVRSPKVTGDPSIFCVAPDGDADPSPLDPAPPGLVEFRPRWSPDGRSLVVQEATRCVAGTCGGEWYVTVIRLSTGERHRLTRAAAPVWSPDGSRIAFVGFYGDHHIFELDVDKGGSRRRLASPEIVREDLLSVKLSWQPICDRRGTPGADQLRAAPLGSLVCGFAGNDTLTGGPRNDRLFGGEGNDSISTAGGGFDIVGCGPGRDAVVADRKDLVGKDCERTRWR